MIYYVLMVDGRCLQTTSPNLSIGFEDVCSRLGYDDYNEFHDDLNMVEWKADGKKYVKNYKTSEISISDDSEEYFLSAYLNFKKTKKPTRQLAEEFDDIVEA